MAERFLWNSMRGVIWRNSNDPVVVVPKFYSGDADDPALGTLTSKRRMTVLRVANRHTAPVVMTVETYLPGEVRFDEGLIFWGPRTIDPKAVAVVPPLTLPDGCSVRAYLAANLSANDTHPAFVSEWSDFIQ